MIPCSVGQQLVYALQQLQLHLVTAEWVLGAVSTGSMQPQCQKSPHTQVHPIPNYFYYCFDEGKESCRILLGTMHTAAHSNPPAEPRPRSKCFISRQLEPPLPLPFIIIHPVIRNCC